MRANEPADSVQVTVSNKKSGKIYDLCYNMPCTGFRGRYPIMNDRFVDSLSREGEQILVKGKKNKQSFRQDYTIRGGRCHIHKVAGPDTVRMRSNG